MGTTRLVFVALLVTAFTLCFLLPTFRRAFRERIEELRWRARGETADGFYRKAEARYQIGEFEDAMAHCHWALRLESRHASARALLMEVEFILGRGRVNPSAGDYDRFMQTSLGPR